MFKWAYICVSIICLQKLQTDKQGIRENKMQPYHPKQHTENVSTLPKNPHLALSKGQEIFSHPTDISSWLNSSGNLLPGPDEIFIFVITKIR